MFNVNAVVKKEVYYRKNRTIRTIDDFGVSDFILLGGTNSGQSSIKCSNLTCNVETPSLKKL